MAEAAGLVIGVVGLFGSCVKGYKIISSAKSVNKDSATLSCRLEIEEKRLILWGRNAGLTESTCLPPVRDLDTIIKVLTQIKILTQDANELEKRYGIKIDAQSEIQLMVDSEEYLQSSVVLMETTRRLQVQSPSQRNTPWKKAFRWIFDRDGFAKLVDDLKALNDGLNALLQESQMRVFRDQFNAMCLESCSIQDTERLSIIREAMVESYPTLSQIVDQRMHALDIQGGDFPIAQSPEAISLLELRDLSISKSVTPDHGRHFARWKGMAVMVEWRQYDAQLPTHDKEIIEGRYRTLSMLLSRKPKPHEFRVLDSVGYCCDVLASSFGLVYAIPDRISTNGTPSATSLHDMITLHGGALPSLGERFRLCSMLVESISQLHTANWLHRNLSSSSILFFGQPDNRSRLPPPIVSGFTFARPDSLGELSVPLYPIGNEVLYQHPEMVEDPRRGYHRAYDIYSLGIVLVEIGFWKPISAFSKAKYTLRQNSQRLMKNQLEGDLAHRMGQSFENAVKKCLSWTIHGGTITDRDQVLDFFENVVLKVDIRSLNHEDSSVD